MNDSFFNGLKSPEGGALYTEPGKEGQPHQQYLFSVLLERLDREYAQCRAALLQTFEMIQEIPALSNDDARQLYRQLDVRLAQLESAFANRLGAHPGASPRSGDPRESARRMFSNRRIRWGESVEEIRRNIFAQLDRLQELDQPLTTESIKRYVPGMLRWLYGQQKLFNGIESLREAYEAWKSTKESANPDHNAAV